MNNPPQDPQARPADAVPSSWVERAPPETKPYLRLMRLDRPIGIWLLFWPCVFGLVVGAASLGRGFPDPWNIVLMGLGSIAMRGAGCTYNDIIDRDFDAQVARTRGRPIPSGAVSVKAAWIFAGAQAFAGLLILLTFNTLTIILGVSSLVLVIVYPFMKRVTWWPQTWLGLTFNWGALLGFTAEVGHLGLPAYVLYAGCFFWTLGYDTIYAHQDKEDDVLIGVKSSARKLGPRTRPWRYIFYALTVGLILLSGFLAHMGIIFALAMIPAGVHIVALLRTLNADRPLLCLRLFKANRDIGALIAAALMLGAMAAV